MLKKIEEARRQALKLHPDRNPGAEEAALFKLLPDARRRALNMVRTGTGAHSQPLARDEDKIRQAMEYRAAWYRVREEKRRQATEINEAHVQHETGMCCIS